MSRPKRLAATRSRRNTTLLPTYAIAVCIAGLPVLAAIVTVASQSLSVRVTPTVVVLGLFVALGELLPIRVPSAGREEEVAASATFAFALLLTTDIATAAPVLTTAAMLADLARRRPLWRIGFDVSAYTLSLTAAGRVLRVLSEQLSTSIGSSLNEIGVGAIIVAGGTFFLVNHALVGILEALEQDEAILDHIVRSFLFKAYANGTLLAIAPIVLVLAERSIFFLPLLIPPIAALYRVGSVSLAKERQAKQDTLTGLPNRVLFHEHLDAAVTSAHRFGERFSVLVMNLDRFRAVNDSLGHAVGDALLRAVGGRIRSAAGEDATVARLGGDEFAVALPPIDKTDAAESAAGMLSALESPFAVGGVDLVVDASIGAVSFPEHGEEGSIILQRADMAMRAAKSSGAGYEVFADEHDTGDPERLSLLADLRHALEARELRVLYQPQLAIASERLCGAEALLRWTHPLQGELPPNAFVPLAERTGLIRPLTRFVIADAARMWLDLERLGLEVTLSMNVSAANLHDASLAEDVAAVLAQWPVPPSRMKLEVTETVAMTNSVRAGGVLESLAALGLQLSLDDYGSGYSSLAYLRRLPVTELKIDKAFVTNVTRDRASATIVRSTVELAHDLGLGVVAEGVETHEVLDFLREHGCDIAQGFLIGRALDPEIFAARLRDGGS